MQAAEIQQQDASNIKSDWASLYADKWYASGKMRGKDERGEDRQIPAWLSDYTPVAYT